MDIKKGSKKNDTFTVEYGNNNNIAIKTSNGKDTLYIKGLTDLTKFKWNIDNSDVVITNSDNTDSIRLLDYFKLNGKHSLKYLKLDNVDSLIIMDNDFITNAINITSETRIKKSTVNGTNFKDDINADEFRLFLKNSDNIPDTINHDRKGLTLNGGNGNDIITGTIYSDTLSGGKGTNTLVFADEFGNDTVKLTKDEKLTIDLTAYGLTSIDDLKFDNSTKHLKITVPDGEEDKYGTIILENLIKKDIVGSKGYVKFKLSDTNIVDIKEVDIFDVDVDNKSLKITGTRFSETIDASGYKQATGKNNRGVIINADAGYNTIIGTDEFNDTITGGNDGNDITAKNGNKTITTGSGADTITIIGEGNRTIKAGNGENAITITGDGKNVITTGKDKDIIVVDSDTTNSINAGAGKNDITIKGSADSVIKTGNDDDVFRLEKGYELGSTQILAGGGTNEIIINNTGSWGDLTLTEEKLNAKNIIKFTNDFEISPDDYELTKRGDDLILTDKNAVSTITLNKYFINNNKKTSYSFNIGETEYSAADFINAVGGIEVKGKGTLRGTEYSDYIQAEGRKAATIYTGRGDDTVGYSEGNKTIYFYEGDGHDIVEDGGGISTLKFTKGTKVTAEYSGGDLVISYGDKGDTVTLPYYNFADDSRKYYYVGNKKYAVSSLNGIGRSITFDKYKASVVGTNGSDVISDERYDYKGKNFVTIDAKDGGDVIYALSDYVNAGNGNDYIRSEISYVYGGNGNDTFTDSCCWFGSIYYFKSGDGNDTMFSRSDNLLVFMDENSIDDLDISMNNKEFVVKYNGGQDSITWKIEQYFEQQSEYYGIQVGNKQYIYNSSGSVYKTIDDINSLNQTVLSWNNDRAGYEYFKEAESSAKTIEQVMLTFTQAN